jgi:hypothetical protein
MAVSHLQMFYETRQAVHINDSDASNNPNTELSQVPEAAEIRYEGFPNRFIDSDQYEAPNGKGYETAQLLIGRAMLDPDATVVPA